MAKPVILLVDDDNGNREVLKDYLSLRIKCVMAEASNGEEALKYISDNKVDLMILDIRMPKKSGLDVLDEIKGNAVSTIVVTAWDSEQVFNKCKEKGAKHYIAKGTSLKVIYDKIIKELKEKDMYYPLD